MKSLAAGFRALGHGKLILLLALATAFIGFSAAVPLHKVLEKDVGGTLAGDHFLRNHPTFAPTDYFDFLKMNESVVDGVAGAAPYFLVVAVLLQMFFAGGMVVVLGRGSFSFGQFFEPARRNFWHNVKCFFLFAILAGIVLGLFFGGAYAVDKKIFADTPPGATSGVVFGWAVRLAAVILWGVLSLWYDFARAVRRYSSTVGAWRAYGFARRALRGSWTRGLVLYLFWLILGAAAWLGAILIAWTMPAVSPVAIALLLAVQFATIYVRSAVRVAAWGSYVEFLDHRAPRALTETYAAHPPREVGLARVPVY